MKSKRETVFVYGDHTYKRLHREGTYIWFEELPAVGKVTKVFNKINENDSEILEESFQKQKRAKL